MPQGCVSLVEPIITDIFLSFKDRTGFKILDCGIGFGFYGAVVRQWLDGGVSPWRTYLLGIEGFEDYESPCWNLYNWIHTCTIQHYLDSPLSANDTFSVILLLDVLEHFTKEEGTKILEKLKGKLAPGGVLYVGTPSIWIEQGSAYGNILECHQSLWTSENLEDLGFSVILDGSPDTYGYMMILGKYQNCPA
jgi:SAM-dependent methyltransferase